MRRVVHRGECPAAPGHAPGQLLAEERSRLHPVPAVPFTAALGVTRKADALWLVSFEGGRYSVPHRTATHSRWSGPLMAAGRGGPLGRRDRADNRCAPRSTARARGG